jgi:hypothetical protein
LTRTGRRINAEHTRKTPEFFACPAIALAEAGGKKFRLAKTDKKKSAQEADILF